MWDKEEKIMHHKVKTFHGETVWLQIAGRIEDGHDRAKLDELLRAFGSDEYDEVVIDLALVTHIDEKAIDVLISASERIRSFRLLNSTQVIRNVMRSKTSAQSVFVEQRQRMDCGPSARPATLDQKVSELLAFAYAQ
jgi:anti-anti-sigma regulatory factor